MLKKKKKGVLKKNPAIEPESTPITKQDTYTKDPKLHISEQAMPIQRCTVDIANEVPVEEPMPDVAMDETLPEVTMPEPLAEELAIVEPLYDVGVEDVMKISSAASGSMPEQHHASPYTQPPVQLLIGPEEIIHYVPRHRLPDNFVCDGFMKQVSLRGMDIGTGHTFVHYFHTGLYETISPCGNPEMLNSGIKLKHALSVYIASIHHDIPCLNALAISEMKTHASRLDLVEVLRAIGEGFQRLDPESWVHEYLQEKAKAAFEENHAVFTSQPFLDTLDNSKVAKFMMGCMAECYNEKISHMDRREKEMSGILSDCQNDLRVMSQKKAVSEHDNAIQHKFITLLASGPTISECCEIKSFCDDLVSYEDFCTISCPPSEYSHEPRGCPDEITQCSAEPRQHSRDATKMISNKADLARSMSSEQPLRSVHLAPGGPIEAIHEPTGEAAAKQCSRNPQECHHLLEIQTSKDNVAAQTIMKEKKQKKETKKQRKIREKRELQEMKELWEAVKRDRSDPDNGGGKVTKPEVQPDHQDKAHKNLVRNAGGGDEHIADLEAAVALILKNVESIQSFRNSDERLRRQKPYEEGGGA